MTQLSIPQAFDLGLRFHKEGRLAEAERIYRQVIAVQPAHVFALHNLAVLCGQTRRNDEGVAWFQKALSYKSDWAEAHSNLANLLRESGRLDEALTECQSAIELEPEYPEAQNNLGMVLKEKGQLNEAISAHRRAISLRANYPEAFSNLSLALKESGKFAEAIEAGQSALALRPNYPEAYNNLGLALKEKGQLKEAINAFRAAIVHAPQLAEAHNNLADALLEKGDTDAAMAAVQSALKIRPDYPEAHHTLGLVLKNKRRLNEAITAIRRAMTLKPDFAAAHNNLGNLLMERGELGDAISAFEGAAALQPDFAEAYNNLSIALQDSGRLDEGIGAAKRAIALRPDYADAYLNLGNAQSKHQVEDAMVAYERAISLGVDYAEPRYNLGLMHLTRGEFAPGWEGYEYRWKCKEFPPLPSLAAPLWDGRRFDGQTLLIYTEQGFGDTLHFFRYLPIVAERGGSIILQCQPALHRLLENSAGGAFRVILSDEKVPSFDWHIPLLSLPRILQTRLENIPADTPYLRAMPDQIAKWREKLGKLGPGLKVGLVWRGSSGHKHDRNRSIPLANFAALVNQPGALFFSLQKGEQSPEEKNLLSEMKIIDWTESLHDFADTAALVVNLDLVISVDTAVAHLAGALAKQVWTLLAFSPDWRWMLRREDSPWYPTMRLFRQKTAGDWIPILQNVASESALTISRTQQ